jgi:hypothetical protein
VECPFCRGRDYLTAEEYRLIVTALVKALRLDRPCQAGR